MGEFHSLVQEEDPGGSFLCREVIFVGCERLASSPMTSANSDTLFQRYGYRHPVVAKPNKSSYRFEPNYSDMSPIESRPWWLLTEIPNVQDPPIHGSGMINDYLCRPSRCSSDEWDPKPRCDHTRTAIRIQFTVGSTTPRTLVHAELAPTSIYSITRHYWVTRRPAHELVA